MAYFYSTRGWLEVDPEHFGIVVNRLQAIQAAASSDPHRMLYSQGWCWNDQQVNWTRYIFFGADLPFDGLKAFEEALKDVTHAGANVSGFFHAQGEDGRENFEYEVIDDSLSVKNAAEKIPST